MNDNPDNTQLVLPIVCSHCGKENNLAVDFALLPPGAVKGELNDRDDDDSDEDDLGMPPTEEEND
jgi:hypothetical protein